MIGRAATDVAASAAVDSDMSYSGIDATALDDYYLLDSDERQAFMTVALSNNGLLIGPPAGDIGEEAGKAQYGRIAAREELISACMKSEGFDYWPEPAEAFFVPLNDPEFAPASRDWVDYYGFEISTMLFLGDHVLPDGVHGYRGDMGEILDGEKSPNERYIETLGPEELAAYRLAFNGTGSDTQDASGDRPQNCWDDAWEAVPEPDYLGGFSADETLQELVMADPAWIAHERSIAACLADQGYESVASHVDLTAMYERLLQDEGVLPPDGRGVDEANGEMLEWESSEWFDALQSVQVQERAHALAFYDCGGDQASRVKVMTGIIEMIAADSE